MLAVSVTRGQPKRAVRFHRPTQELETVRCDPTVTDQDAIDVEVNVHRATKYRANIKNAPDRFSARTGPTGRGEAPLHAKTRPKVERTGVPLPNRPREVTGSPGR